MQLRVSRQIVYAVLLSMAAGLGQRTVHAQWTAYNDCLRESGDSTADLVTGWTIHNGNLTHNTGLLVDHATGSSDAMPTVTFTMGSAGISVSSGGAGGNPVPGTDAFDLFSGLIDFGPNTAYYGRPGWWVEIEFSGLNPDSRYTFAGTAIRSNDYPERISQFTLLDAVSALNASSEGVAGRLPDTTLLIAGDNSVTGYVARWDNIIPSAEGTFTIRAEATADSDSGKAYPLGGFMLSMTTDGSQPEGLEVDAGEYDAVQWPLHTTRLYPTVEAESPDDLNGLIYTWGQLTGPRPAAFDPSSDMADPNVIFPEPGEYELELTVENAQGLQGSARVTITVLRPVLVGDLDGNVRVNWRDLEIFTALWLDPSENLSNLDAQGPVNLQDFAMLSQNWGVGENTTLVINEILARNDLFNTDPQNEHEDWIEIMNVGDSIVDLAGMYLTDDLSDATMWRFPSDRPTQTLLAPGYRVLVWADGDIGDTGLHAAFQLNAETGGEVGLFERDGVTLVDSLEFGPQTPDVAFGHDPDAFGLLTTLRPTPTQSNTGALLPVIDAMVFSAERGFYEGPVAVDISTTTSGTTIHYTLDGSSPSPQRGLVYQSPITIETTTCLRAMAFRPGYKSTGIVTHTYLFLQDVIHQATAPSGAQASLEGFPDSWNGTSGNYQVDPDVVDMHADTIQGDLLSVPTVSLVMDVDDWFGPTGIYINKSQDGTERVCSLEFVDPLTGDSIQINTALAMQGGVSGGGTSLNRWKTLKLSMRPRFKPQTDDGRATGGPGKANFRFFPGSPITRFNSIVLDAVLNHSFLHSSSGQRNTATYVQDQYVADLHNAMGGQSPHGDYVHLYLNGLYWGMYYLHERPDHTWISQLQGGDEDEYDAIKHNRNGVINHGIGGNATANVDRMVDAASAVSSDRTNLEKFNALASQLDLDNFITYLLATWFCGNHDWPHKNWYATHHNVPGGKWRFHSWDAEHSLEGGHDVGESPLGIHNKLRNNAEYRMRFTDLIYKHFFNHGPLTAQGASELFSARVDQVYQAMVGESARWGDTRRSNPHTRDEWYQTQVQKLTQFFPSRTSQVLSRLKSEGLYPNMDAPLFVINGAESQGGQIDSDPVTIAGIANSIYYTTDGSDPRLPGGAIHPNATLYQTPLTLTESVQLKSRHHRNDQWSAIQEVIFAVGPVSESLRITEIMYHPENAGHAYDPNTEFIELQNIGPDPINLNLVRFTDGISFTFPAIDLAPQAYVLVARDIDAFEAKYGSELPVAGQYEGALSNGGERLTLVNAANQVVHDFEYDDKWYKPTDGKGFSLVVTWPTSSDPTQWGDQNLWRQSHAKGGSPGAQE